MTPATTAALAKLSGDALFALQSYKRFLVSYAGTVLGLETKYAAPGHETEAELRADIEGLRQQIAQACEPDALDDPWHQLFSTVLAVFKFWSPRAVSYRAREHIDGNLGTAVNVQAMVFVNLDDRSGTGVAFTRNPSTGEAGPCGDFLFRAQGDDVVGGTHRTLPLQDMAGAFPIAYGDLLQAMERLEAYHRDLCDIEFTIERSKLWMLQARIGKRSPAAAPRIAVDLVREGKVGLDKPEAIRRIGPGASVRRRSDRARGNGCKARGAGSWDFAGRGNRTSGFRSGSRRRVLSGDGTDLILVRQETSPEDLHGMGVARGILTTLGGMMSHAAVVARAWNIPAVRGVTGVELTDSGLVIGGLLVREGDILSIDGDTGAVYLGPIAATAAVDPYLETLRDWAAEAATVR